VNGVEILFNHIVKWEFDPTPIFFLALAGLYVRSLALFGNRKPVERWQIHTFFLGICILIGASLPPIDTISDQLFSMHMAQHLLITVVGVPLLMMGAPYYVCIRGVPRSFRTYFILRIVRNKFVTRVWNTLQRPLVAVFLYEGTMWFWHIPNFYNLALLDDNFHLLEHTCMALAALNLWRVLLDVRPMRARTSPLTAMGLITLIMTMDIALSAALTYSNRVWYAYEFLPQPAWWSWDRLSDQQLGGLIMWVPGSGIWLLALIFIFTKSSLAYEPRRLLKAA
jgi:cytochrome c oxidase assembly factor CtaG